MQIGGLGALGLTLPQVLRAAEVSGVTQADSRANRILLLFLHGAASQFETWDPQPLAPSDIHCKWGAISTSVPGAQIGDLLPRVAKYVDRMAIVRSMTH